MLEVRGSIIENAYPQQLKSSFKVFKFLFSLPNIHTILKNNFADLYFPILVLQHSHYVLYIFVHKAFSKW